MSTEIKIDTRGLEPPEPMERVLDALSQLKLGATLSMLVDREPRPLFRILDKNGFAWELKPGPEYSFEVRIWHKV